jgi:hypothetical protein
MNIENLSSTSCGPLRSHIKCIDVNIVSTFYVLWNGQVPAQYIV